MQREQLVSLLLKSFGRLDDDLTILGYQLALEKFTDEEIKSAVLDCIRMGGVQEGDRTRLYYPAEVAEMCRQIRKRKAEAQQARQLPEWSESRVVTDEERRRNIANVQKIIASLSASKGMGDGVSEPKELAPEEKELREKIRKEFERERSRRGMDSRINLAASGDYSENREAGVGVGHGARHRRSKQHTTLHRCGL